MKRTRELRSPSHHALSPEALAKDLEELSHNLWWSWSPDAKELLRRVASVIASRGAAGAAAAFRENQNPVPLVRSLRRLDLEALSRDEKYVALHRRVLEAFRAAFDKGRPLEGFSHKAPVAYFSMEFGVHESLPIYAGGLGILAGDHAKSAHDESLPLVGVGLFYHNGYFRQELDGRGKQRVIYPKADVAELPVEAVKGPRGKELRIAVELPGRRVFAKVWRVGVGRVSLYLLDSDVPENSPKDRRITYKLYGGSREDRIQQEILAGIGGVRALEALGIEPSVWHLNEGHVAFLTIERLRRQREKFFLLTEAALEAIASNTVFTTHTPVPEGNETFDLALAKRYLEPYAKLAWIPVEEYLKLGLDRGKDRKPCFSMTVLALRLSRFRNGVSALHGQVSRKMWARLWPGFRAEDAPITSVTNGVHTPSWVSPELDELISKHVGKRWREHLDDPRFWKGASRLPEKDLWRAKQALKARMVRFVREREDRRLERLGWSAARRKAHVEKLLDPGIFTIGFARRFALYKRAALLFKDTRRALRLFASRSRPVQIVFAGKPHPEDPQGKLLFEQIAAISRRKGLRGKVVLVENYDIEVARHIVQGVDLWLNNPRRPLEASGTSGQKVPINGGLNASILDGWWCEGYSKEAGWAFGRPVPYADEALQDAEDSESLYRVLEKEILPLYYRRGPGGVPAAWFRRVKSSMARLVSRFSTSHMVREYARRLYRPAGERGKAILARRALMARVLDDWKVKVLRSWPLAHVRSASRGKRGSVIVDLFLPGYGSGQDHLGARDDDGQEREIRLVQALGSDLFRFEVGAPRGASPRRAKGATLRLYPTHPLLAHPRELGLSLEVML